MSRALIGYTGFVGSNLLRQQHFDDCYNSANIAAINGQRYDVVICAGVPAAKWIANREPVRDRANIQGLMTHLAAVEADRFVLISTVDVYPLPVGVDEESAIDIEKCEPYGKHRLELEYFVADRFDTCIVRLPGLFGKGLKKNIIYDFLHDNNVNLINPNGVFQFYSLKHLTHDIDVALENNLKILNITSEPVSVMEVAQVCLGQPFTNTVDQPAARYDYRSLHAHLFGGHDGYLYSKHKVLADLRGYVNEERQRVE